MCWILPDSSPEIRILYTSAEWTTAGVYDFLRSRCRIRSWNFELKPDPEQEWNFQYYSSRIVTVIKFKFSLTTIVKNLCWLYPLAWIGTVKFSAGCSGWNVVADWRALFCLAHTYQRWARIRTGWDWIKTEANFCQIRTWSDCNFFENWRMRSGLDWENFCCFNVIILKISKILVVMRFHLVC